VIHARGGVGIQHDAAKLREHGRHFDLPAIGQLERRGQFGDLGLDACRAPERHRARERQHVGERLDHAPERLLEQDALGRDQPMLLDGVIHRREQRHRRAGLGEKAEDLALVDGGRRRVHVRITGEQHAHGVRRQVLRLGEEGGAVHARHAHVGHHYRGIEPPG
jgi:hypothetical protein